VIAEVDRFEIDVKIVKALDMPRVATTVIVNFDANDTDFFELTPSLRQMPAHILKPLGVILLEGGTGCGIERVRQHGAIIRRVL
jgi:hypothetical protein